ncbi:hypothetical protein BKA70DRAFT_1233418 [Coprinopsis sp. MPI-PUGE-AT-0042]|nr:hypothetical protein BKA70DRAFT_1233418 [Coprinopsis sp. MPI-PUGE-AT-0042]
MAKRGERGALANMLGMALRHKPDQLQESQVYSRQAVEYSPQDWAILKNFATTLLLCHKQDPSQEYLKEAQFACEKALEWCPTEKREAIGALRTELAEELLNFLETAAFEPEL